MRVVGVRFKAASRVYTFDAGAHEFGSGDWAVVETERGMALGQVVGEPREAPDRSSHPLKRVLRRAEERDVLRYEQNCELEGYAQQFCLELIRERKLPMKLVDVEVLFDGSKALFYFTADDRVDFRDLVRDLARQFHTRIEMRQIGVRDEAKMVGGVGGCGQPLCCSTWLTDFAPISVRMAKEQNVSLNPSKISGICGRLMCCLAYEHGMYREMGQEIPKLGKRVETPKGEGRVVRRNVLEGTFLVAGEGREFEISVDEYLGRVPVAPPAPEAELVGRQRPSGRAGRPPGRGGRPDGPPDRRRESRPVGPADRRIAPPPEESPEVPPEPTAPARPEPRRAREGREPRDPRESRAPAPAPTPTPPPPPESPAAPEAPEEGAEDKAGGGRRRRSRRRKRPSGGPGRTDHG